MSKWETLNKLYLDKGLKIFPVKENGKTPLIPKWQTDCSKDFMQVLYWYENAKNCNWGLPASQNNLFVIDLDMHEVDGVGNFTKLLEDLDLNINTLIQHTPTGGVHIIFKSDDELKNVSNSSNSFPNFPGIDIRTDGYIVVEPSTINSNGYLFEDSNVTPTEMPIQLKEYILKNVGTKQENTRKPYEKPKEVFKGDRDNQLFQYINQLYFKTRLDYDEILLLANHFNETVFDTPLPKKNVKYKVEKAFDKDRGTCLFLKVGGENDED